MFASVVVAQLAARPSFTSYFQSTAGPAALMGTTPPPPIPLAKGSQMDSFQSSSQGNQSVVEPPLSVQPIPDSMPVDVKLLLQKFPSFLHTGDVVPNSSHWVEHTSTWADTPPPPVFAKARHLDPENLKLPRRNSNIWNLPELSAIQHHHGRPLCTRFPNKMGLGSFCGDFHHPNLITTPDKYRVPILQDLANGFYGWIIFSKIDLVKSYHQILVLMKDIQKTAILMPIDMFEYLFTPFGLSNAAQTFQRMMDRTVDNLEVVFASMDISSVSSPRLTLVPPLRISSNCEDFSAWWTGCARVLQPLMISWGAAQKCCSGLPQPRRLSRCKTAAAKETFKMQSASLPKWYHFSTLRLRPSFL